MLPFSTGVIMETLPSDRIKAGLAAAIAEPGPTTGRTQPKPS